MVTGIKTGAITVLLAATVLAAPIRAAEPARDDVGGELEQVEEELRQTRSKARALESKAESLDEELGRLQEAKVAAARNIQDLEAKLSELEAELGDLDAAELEKRNLLDVRRDQFSKVLGAIHRISLFPPEAAVVQPLKPAELVRTAILLKSAVPQIEGQATRLRDDLLALNETRNHIVESQRRLDAARTDIEKQRAKLAALHGVKARNRDEVLAARRAEQDRLSALTGKAKDLRELFQRLDEDRRKQAATSPKPRAKPVTPASAPATAPAPPEGERRSFTSARGSIPMPAVGDIGSHYGDVIRPGITRKGILIETRADAQVVAPYDGKVVFAGDFRGYGQLLIIEHSEGYHTLLAGMARIDSVPGQWLLAGEPVGVMGPSAEDKPSLYLELRRKGQPINPLPWLVARK